MFKCVCVYLNDPVEVVEKREDTTGHDARHDVDVGIVDSGIAVCTTK